MIETHDLVPGDELVVTSDAAVDQLRITVGGDGTFRVSNETADEGDFEAEFKKTELDMSTVEEG